MSKAINKDYLLNTLKDFDDDILKDKYGGSASSESIAPIEQSATASQAYEIGDLFFLNKVLYKVTTAIVSGGTIIVEGANANVVITDINSELKNKQNDFGLLVKNGRLCVRYAVEE